MGKQLVRINFLLSVELKERLEALAEENETTVSQILRSLAKKYADQMERNG